ncbi:MAG TPA: FecR family protein [Hanamia sp.]|nr:FecR family protein [Hanamia sp.]
MDNQSFLTLATRILSGEATDEDSKELETFFETNDLYKTKFGLLKEFWENKNSISTDTDKALQKLLLQIREEKEEGVTNSFNSSAKNKTLIHYLFKYSKVAVLILGCFVAGYFIFNKNTHDSIAKTQPVKAYFQIKETPKGAKSTIVLADGTKVTMNSDSRLKFPTEFSGETREVFLTGEAFFDVTHNAKVPFIIHTNKMNIKVLGTEFNVKSYPEDSTSETTLIRGLIEVTLNDRPSDKIILRPKEKLVVSNEPSSKQISSIATSSPTQEARLVISSLHYVSAKDSAIVETSWLDNKLVFQDESFGKLARDLERRYGINIRFSNSSVREFRFTGVFEKETIDEVLKALKLTEKFNYKIEGKNITIF